MPPPPHPPKLLQKNSDVNYETSGRIDRKQTGESNVPGDVSSRVRRSGSLTEEQLGEADEDGLLGICSWMRLPERKAAHLDRPAEVLPAGGLTDHRSAPLSVLIRSQRRCEDV